VQSVIQLALEKTRDDYGEYQLNSATKGINIGRVTRQLEQGEHKNLFIRLSITDDLAKRFQVIPFPIARGLAGYRVALIHQQNKNNFCNASDNFIKRASSVQGVNWVDIDILNANGFNVFPISSYDRMFHMIERKRVDTFFRSIGEITIEYAVNHKQHPNIMIEPCIAIYYPLPRFLVTHKSNVANAKRIKDGLIRAHQDGSFNQLWANHFAKRIKLLKGRRVIELDNPFLKNVNPAYKKYNYTIKY
jgi:hypothetical protein